MDFLGGVAIGVFLAFAGMLAIAAYVFRDWPRF